MPLASRWREIWKTNLEKSFESGTCQFCNLEKLRHEGKRRIVEHALEFTSKYRNVENSNLDPNQVVMAGHQPGLFHPGVWYKNFVLGEIGNRSSSYAINLIVDNDVCNAPTGIFPESIDGSQHFKFGRLSYDANTEVSPFENRKIQNLETFTRFGELGCRKILEFSNSPLLRRLWPQVLSAADDQNLGNAIARGRHKLEEEFGLNTLELPISRVASSLPFTTFAREILSRIDDFRTIYNETAYQYRLLNRIRSRARPVPDLKQVGNWFETPFWIWTQSSPNRRSLFAKIENQQLVLTDRENIVCNISVSCSNEEFHQQLTNDICVRPKALMTTLYARLVASDLFIHGIGGSKYDQLTDEICRKFFDLELPDYLTISGTFLIQHSVAAISSADIGDLKNQLRQLEFHPEQFLESSNGATTEFVEEKLRWIKQDLPLGQRLLRHRGIAACNEQLHSFVSNKRKMLESKLAQMQQNFGTAKVLNSREFSFCFYNEDLPGLLTELAATNFF